MGIYLNPVNELFRKALNSEIYVDKSMLIDYTNRMINTNQQNICVSRPRRFGKSIAEHMLAAYYSRGCNSEKLFADLKIAGTKDFRKHLNQYNVVFLNMADFTVNGASVEQMIHDIWRRISFELKKEYREIEVFDWNDIVSTLEIIYEETGIPFVFIIDEWDVIFRKSELSNNKSEQKKYLDFLRFLLKDRSYVGLAYMTGILPIKKYGEHSALNMFAEYSMTNQRQLAEFTGFTEDEVKELCKRFPVDYEAAKAYYNGYLVNGIPTYNPKSVVEAFGSGVLDNYWTKTETYEALKAYIVLDFDGLKEAVTELVAGERIPIDTITFTNDMVNFTSKDDVLTLLVHLGYLTYDAKDKTVWIPNKEVRDEFISSIRDGGWEQVVAAIRESGRLLDATLAMDADTVAQMIDKAHTENVSIIKYNDENSLSCVLSLAYYKARDSYEIYREMPGGRGFADLVFVPRLAKDPALVVELKWDKTKETALDQIRDRRYTEGLKNYQGKILLVGINYNKTTKKHSVEFETVEKE